MPKENFTGFSVFRFFVVFFCLFGLFVLRLFFFFFFFSSRLRGLDCKTGKKLSEGGRVIISSGLPPDFVFAMLEAGVPQRLIYGYFFCQSADMKQGVHGNYKRE